MGTNLRPGQAVVIKGNVDRLLSAADQGIDAVAVRVANPMGVAKADREWALTVAPDDVVEAEALLTYTAEHRRLGEWLKEHRPQALEPADFDTWTGAVDATVRSLERLARLEALLEADGTLAMYDEAITTTDG